MKNLFAQKLSFSAAIPSILITALATPCFAGSLDQYPDLNKKTATSVMTCARNIVEKNLNSETGLKTALDYLSSVQNNIENNNALAAAYENCSEYISSHPTEKFPANFDQQEYLSTLPGSESAKELMKNFMSPTASCTKAGVSLGLTFFASIGAKVDVAHCIASNGRTWIQLSVGSGMGVGTIGAGITLDGGKERMVSKDGKLQRFNYYSKEMFLLGAGASVESDSSNEVDDYNLPANGYGGGVGIGINNLVGEQVDLDIVPLGTNGSALLSQLLGLK